MMLRSKKSSFLSWFMLQGLKDISEFAKKTKRAFISSIVSLFLLFSFSLGNVVSARASSASVGNSISSTKSNSDSKGENKYRSANSKKQISNRRVEVEIVASGSSVKSIKATEKKPSQHKKAYKRKKNQNSLTNDLYELEQEAEFEVKQSWDSLTGSMKGEDTELLLCQCWWH